MRVEVAVQGSPSLIVLMICGRKTALKKKKKKKTIRTQELCESRGGRPGLPVPNSLCGLFGRSAALKKAAQSVQ